MKGNEDAHAAVCTLQRKKASQKNTMKGINIQTREACKIDLVQLLHMPAFRKIPIDY